MRGHLRVDGRPDHDDWAELHQELRLLIKDKVKCWEVDLTYLDRPDSHALGMLITLAATIKNRGGSYEFLVRRGSQLAQLVQVTKVDLIVEIRAA